MSDTGISEQIATLREQIATAELEIEARRARLKSPSESDAVRGETALDDLIQARDSMLNRLSRLESCQRGFDP